MAMHGLNCYEDVIHATRKAWSAADAGDTLNDSWFTGSDNYSAGVIPCDADPVVLRWTLRYCLTAFNWWSSVTNPPFRMKTAFDNLEKQREAEEQLLHQDEPPAKADPTSKVVAYYRIDGYNCNAGIIDMCRELAGPKNRPISNTDAKRIWDKVTCGDEQLLADVKNWWAAGNIEKYPGDQLKLSNCDKWTLRYCLLNFNWKSYIPNSMIVDNLGGWTHTV